MIATGVHLTGLLFAKLSIDDYSRPGGEGTGDE